MNTRFKGFAGSAHASERALSTVRNRKRTKSVILKDTFQSKAQSEKVFFVRGRCGREDGRQASSNVKSKVRTEMRSSTEFTRNRGGQTMNVFDYWVCCGCSHSYLSLSLSFTVL
jgi:hypothetical protein